MDQEQIAEKILNFISNNKRILGLDDDFVPERNTCLYGVNGILDSLRLVHLIVAIENELRKAGCKDVVLADAKAFSSVHSPFRTVDDFALYAYKVSKQ